jgi:hypothetical protein
MLPFHEVLDRSLAALCSKRTSRLIPLPLGRAIVNPMADYMVTGLTVNELGLMTKRVSTALRTLGMTGRAVSGEGSGFDLLWEIRRSAAMASKASDEGNERRTG